MFVPNPSKIKNMKGLIKCYIRELEYEKSISVVPLISPIVFKIRSMLTQRNKLPGTVSNHSFSL